ncbi:hypothetical protein L484_012320 [Morus notabilis]|uniref:Terpene synthase metal-binding domain-containing protein n=1 Tax=Morus notabilis TaxID=981085 RepID=W9S2J7_9ROSA|nr:hypothetical protein L484_012320 [Morus notabilis]
MALFRKGRARKRGCSMKQYSASEEEAYEEVRKQTVDAWKDITEDWLDEAKDVPRPLLMRVINLARSIDVIYKDGDNYSNSGGVMRSFIQSLLVDALQM